MESQEKHPLNTAYQLLAEQTKYHAETCYCPKCKERRKLEVDLAKDNS